MAKAPKLTSRAPLTREIRDVGQLAILLRKRLYSIAELVKTTGIEERRCRRIIDAMAGAGLRVERKPVPRYAGRKKGPLTETGYRLRGAAPAFAP
jgi:hypothetical protein